MRISDIVFTLIFLKKLNIKKTYKFFEGLEGHRADSNLFLLNFLKIKHKKPSNLFEGLEHRADSNIVFYLFF
jgi:hypothetical protein